MHELPFISNAEKLVTYLRELHQNRKGGKTLIRRTSFLTRKQRLEVLQKTNFKCHICGVLLSEHNFQADHVKSHISGGAHSIDNYLPSCKTCNNYRWHYTWEELQYILKLGVWARTLISANTTLGYRLAEQFVKHELRRELRRKNKRTE